jgi:hypothetical protein
VFEIMQAQMNLNIFSSLRNPSRTPRVASLARTVVLSLLNFAELILCFGVAYATSSHNLKHAKTWFDPYYFSTITQVTVGYGDLLPLNRLRLLASAQAIFGFVLAVLVIGRLVSFLPRTQPVAKGL